PAAAFCLSSGADRGIDVNRRLRLSVSGAFPMQRIHRDQARKYAFDWEDEPLLHVKPGESFEIETYDASTGYFKTEADKALPARRPGFDRIPPLANPIGGPVYVEGAKKGDTLVVTFEDIVVDS